MSPPQPAMALRGGRPPPRVGAAKVARLSTHSDTGWELAVDRFRSNYDGAIGPTVHNVVSQVPAIDLEAPRQLVEDEIIAWGGGQTEFLRGQLHRAPLKSNVYHIV